MADQQESLAPSDYCLLVQQHLITPLLLEASKLSVEPQQSFMAVMLAALLLELRAVITANTNTYKYEHPTTLPHTCSRPTLALLQANTSPPPSRPRAGLQLMADFCHLKDCVTSTGSPLHHTTTALLSTLPPVLEMERGLQKLCYPGELQAPLPSAQWPGSVAGLLPELDPHCSQDWTDCLL